MARATKAADVPSNPAAPLIATTPPGFNPPRLKPAKAVANQPNRHRISGGVRTLSGIGVKQCSGPTNSSANVPFGHLARCRLAADVSPKQPINPWSGTDPGPSMYMSQYTDWPGR